MNNARTTALSKVLTGQARPIDWNRAYSPNFRPTDPVDRDRWLFDEWFPERSKDPLRDFRESEARGQARRKTSVHEILRVQGAAGVLRLGISCKLPQFVCDLARVSSGRCRRDPGIRCPDAAVSEGDTGVMFAGHVPGRTRQIHGDAWRCISGTGPRTALYSVPVLAALIQWWPDEPPEHGRTPPHLAKRSARSFGAPKPVYRLNGDLRWTKRIRPSARIAAGRGLSQRFMLPLDPRRFLRRFLFSFSTPQSHSFGNRPRLKW